MKLRNLNIIIAREYLTRVKKRSFLLITFLGPMFFAAIAVLPSLIMLMSSDDSQKIALVDQSGIVAEKMKMENTIRFTDISTENADSAKANFVRDGYDVLMVVSPLDTVNHTVDISAYSQKPLSVDLKVSIADEFNKAVEDYRLVLYDVEGLKASMEDVTPDVVEVGSILELELQSKEMTELL